MTHTLVPTFGALLKHVRKRAGMTQGDLAAAVGYSVSFVSVLEQNRRLPDVDSRAPGVCPGLGLAGRAAPGHPAGRAGRQRARGTTAGRDHAPARNADRRDRRTANAQPTCRRHRQDVIGRTRSEAALPAFTRTPGAPADAGVRRTWRWPWQHNCSITMRTGRPLSRWPPRSPPAWAVPMPAPHPQNQTHRLLTAQNHAVGTG